MENRPTDNSEMRSTQSQTMHGCVKAFDQTVRKWPTWSLEDTTAINAVVDRDFLHSSLIEPGRSQTFYTTIR